MLRLFIVVFRGVAACKSGRAGVFSFYMFTVEERVEKRLVFECADFIR